MTVTRKKAPKKARSSKTPALTLQQKKRLADPAPLFPEKLAKANEIIRNTRGL